MSINSCRATATAAFFLSTYYCHSVLYATASMPRNICLAFTCFWSLFLLTDSVSADWLFILSRLLAIQQPGNTHGIYHRQVPHVDMSDPHLILGDTPVQEWIDRYEQSHKDPINRTFHTLGIPMIAISLPLFLVAPLFRGFWKIPLSLFTVGWIFQFAGHAVEGKPPEFFKDWRFLLVGVRWWLSKIQGRA